MFSLDNIDLNIKKNISEIKNSLLINKTWTDFYNLIQEKKLILYGITSTTAFIWLRREKNFLISAAIDNNIEKKGRLLCDFFDEDDLKDDKNIAIQSKEILDKYNPNEVVILISSIKSYKEIAMELEHSNFHCYFSILHMEYIYRENMRKKKLDFSTLATYRNNYAKKCALKYSIQKNKIIFFDMGAYLDHGKYITEQLLLMDKNLDIVWITSDISIKLPKNVRIIKSSDWKNFTYEMETASIWIINILPLPMHLLKRRNQICIQIKHWGSITLKKFYLDDIEDLDKKNTEYRSINLINNDKKVFRLNGTWTDYIITGSKFDEDSCRKGFNFNGECIRCGSPRSDILFKSKDYKLKIYSILNLKDSENIALYVPTYRRYDFKNDLNFEILLNSLIQKWPGNWKILIRLHPFDKKKSYKIRCTSYVIDVSNYDDGEELVAASDLMLSDYSSIMFEPAYVFKPVFLYAPDKDKYLNKDRDFLLDYDSLPFPISKTNKELSNQILNFDENNYKSKVQNFFDKYDIREDGHASERAAKFILDLLSKEGEIHA